MASNVPTSSRGGGRQRARVMQVIRNSSKKKGAHNVATDKLSETKKGPVTSPSHKSNKFAQETVNVPAPFKLNQTDRSLDKKNHFPKNHCIKPSSLIYCDSTENKPPYCILCNLNLEARAKDAKDTDKNQLLTSIISNHQSTIEHNNKYRDLIRYAVLWNLPRPIEEHYILLNNYIDSVYATRAADITLTTKKEYVLNELREILLKTSGPEYVLRPVGSSFTGAELKESDLNLQLVYLKEPPGHFSSRGIAYTAIHTKLINPEADVGEQINHHVLHYDLVPNAMKKLYDLGITLYSYSRKTDKNEGEADFILKSNPAQIHSRVPRLVLLHSASRVTVEICSYIDSSHLSKMLKWYLDLDLRAKKLSIFLKSWALQMNFNNPNAGSLPPYAYVLIVIHYLQRTEPPILPCIHKMIEEKSKLQKELASLSIVSTPDELTMNEKSKTSLSIGKQEEHSDRQNPKEKLKFSSIDNDSDNDDVDLQEDDEDNVSSVEEEEEEEEEDIMVDEMFDSFTWSTQNEASEAELLIGLFRYISLEFELTKYVLSIRTLEPKLKKKKWKSSILAIEDPTRPTLNISRAIGTLKLFNNFFQNFQETYRYLLTPPVHKELNVQPGIIFQDANADCVINNEAGLKLCLDCARETSDNEFTDKFRELVKILKISVDFKMWSVARDLLKDNFEKLSKSEDALFSFSTRMKGFIDVPLFCLGCRGYHHINENCPTMIRNSADQISPQIVALTDPGLDAVFITNWESSKIDYELADYHKLIVQQVSSIIKESTKLDCKLELFGSAVNGLGQRTSDLDICMTINNNPNGKGIKFVKILKKIVPGLEKSTFIQDVVPVLSAKVPIIKFQYIATNWKAGMDMTIDVDLSMYNQCACYNTKLIKTYCDIDYRVAILCFVVRTMVKVGIFFPI